MVKITPIAITQGLFAIATPEAPKIKNNKPFM
jgi:hypothetical protein